ncbi:MAG: glycosyltransferase family 4 protein [Mangrovibacterium sp.]
MRKLNWIILSCSDRGVQYGVGTFIRQLSMGLSESKDVAVFILEISYSNYKTLEIRKEHNITILEIPSPLANKRVDLRKNQEKMAKSIARVVRQYIPEAEMNVVHMNFIYQYFTAKELSQALNGVCIFTKHIINLEDHEDQNNFDLEEETCNMVNQVVAVSSYGKDCLIDKGINKDKISIIYNGLSPEQFKTDRHNDIREKFGFEKDEHLILYSGRLDLIKGVNYLASAFGMLLKRLPDCRLVIAGNGDFESLINATRLFSSRVSYLGFLPVEDLVSLYYGSTIGVIPSLDEQYGYVALEMLYCGLPVVASNIGGLKEIFIHNRNALLVDMIEDRNNPFGLSPKIDQFSEYMYGLLVNEPLRKTFSKNAVARAIQTFTREKMVNQYLNLINQLKYDEYQ